MFSHSLPWVLCSLATTPRWYTARRHKEKGYTTDCERKAVTVDKQKSTHTHTQKGETSPQHAHQLPFPGDGLVTC